MQPIYGPCFGRDNVEVNENRIHDIYSVLTRLAEIDVSGPEGHAVDLSGETLSDINASELQSLINLDTLSSLDIGRNNFSCNTITNLISCRGFLNLQRLCISFNGDSEVSQLPLAESLAQAISSGSQLRFLNVSGNRIGASGASSFAKALAENSILQSLDLSLTNLGDFGVVCLSVALRLNTNLKSLNLNGNEVTCVGAGHIGHTLRIFHCSLNVLDLGNNRIGRKGVTSLIQAATENPTLDVLHLSHNDFNECSLSSILRAEYQLDMLDLKDCGLISSVNTVQLSLSNSLKTLMLDNNCIRDEGALTISASMQTGALSLETLSLCNCGIGNLGARGISFALWNGFAPSLTSLNMDWNHITASTAMQLASSATAHPALVCVSLQYNNFDTSSGVNRMISCALSKKRLRQAKQTKIAIVHALCSSYSPLFVDQNSLFEPYTLKLMLEIAGVDRQDRSHFCVREMPSLRD